MPEEMETTKGDINQASSPNKTKGESANIPSPKRPILRTMKSDMQEYINRQKMSIVDIVGKQANKSGLKVQATESDWLSRIITIAVILLVITSVGVFGYTVIQKKIIKEKKEEPRQNLPAPIIVPNTQKIIDLDTVDTKRNDELLKNTAQVDAPIGNITNFVFIDENKVILRASQFFKSANIKAPLGFSSFLTDQFMFGVYSSDRNEPFIILKIRSYENVFALMLKWEKTIKDDLSLLLAINDRSKDSVFQDRVIKNHDTRIIYGQNGEISLLYSFLDKDTLVITSSTNTFEEILRRLSSSKL